MGLARKDSRSSATREEILETLGVAIYMGAGPAAMYASHALGAYTQFAAPKADAA
jgi:alkylhydroperoxidase/carboxymuconolactone decarboxylase family protein YurZ